MDTARHSLCQQLIGKVVPLVVRILKETISKDLLLADSTVARKEITIDLTQTLAIRKSLQSLIRVAG